MANNMAVQTPYNKDGLVTGAFVLALISTIVTEVLGVIFIIAGVVIQQSGVVTGFTADQLRIVAIVYYIIGAICLLTMAYGIPITVAIRNFHKTPEKSSTTIGIVLIVLGFLIIGLFFGIAGILLVVRKPEQPVMDMNASTPEVKDSVSSVK